MDQPAPASNCFTNYRKLISLADDDWETYSMGGVADVNSLLYLQERYGLFLYLDDSHALSTVGTFGAGLVRPRINAFDEDCLIVASLAKSFGASGGW